MFLLVSVKLSDIPITVRNHCLRTFGFPVLMIFSTLQELTTVEVFTLAPNFRQIEKLR